jgi:nitrite reductase/ring-hydroxylating ferredoxin subunit
MNAQDPAEASSAISSAGSSADETWHKVARYSDLEEEYPTKAKIGSREIALSLVEGAVFATDNICSHAFARLSDGTIEGFEIMCPLHGGSFDVRTGEPMAAPCQTPIGVYECRVEGDDVLVKLDSPSLAESR